MLCIDLEFPKVMMWGYCQEWETNYDNYVLLRAALKSLVPVTNRQGEKRAKF